jgi:hypothetical protein
MAKAKTESSRMSQTPPDQRQTSFRNLMEQLSDFAIFASKLQVCILSVSLCTAIDYFQVITTTVVDSMANRNAKRSLAEDDWKHLRLCLTTELDRGRKLLRLATQIDANLAALEEIACEDVNRCGKYRLHIRLRENEQRFLCEWTSLATNLLCSDSDPWQHHWMLWRRSDLSSQSSWSIPRSINA